MFSICQAKSWALDIIYPLNAFEQSFEIGNTIIPSFIEGEVEEQRGKNIAQEYRVATWQSRTANLHSAIPGLTWQRLREIRAGTILAPQILPPKIQVYDQVYDVSLTP